MTWAGMVGGLLSAAVFFLGGGVAAAGATYYVDFDGGKDTGTGVSPETAFQHAPGDAWATGAAKGTELLPGDSVVFKGGVIYRGAVVVRSSGAAGNPITFDGNTAGTFGKGRAIIDGADAVTGWKRSGSAEEAGGNSKWAEIFYADVPAAGDWRKASLSGESTPLPVAQDPKPAEPIFQEAVDDYHLVKGQLEKKEGAAQEARMTLTDPAVFTQSSPDYYKGMAVGIHGGANMVFYLRVEGYDPAAHRLELGSYSGKQYAQTRYSLFNSVKLIARPGEWSVEGTGDPKVSRVFLLPEKAGAGAPAGVGYSRRAKGFDLEKASHIVVQGFVVRRQSNGAEVFGVLAEGPASHVTVRDCEVALVRGGAGIYISHVDDALVERCNIHDNPGHTPGVVLHTVARGAVRDCTIQRNTSTGLDYYYCTDGQVTGNTVLDQRGMHANGLTFYLNCKNILIERNYVARGEAALTVQDAEGMTIRNNILDGGGRSAGVALWTSEHLKDIRILYNCILGASVKEDWAGGLFTNSKALDGLVVRNNIIDGLSSSGVFARGTFGNNLYTRKGPDQKDGLLGTGESVEPNLGKIFVDAAAGDFKLRTGGPAIGAGMTEEGDGTKGGKGQAINLGPYEAPPVDKR